MAMATIVIIAYIPKKNQRFFLWLASFLRILRPSPRLPQKPEVCPTLATEARGLLTRGDLRSPTCQMTHVIE